MGKERETNNLKGVLTQGRRARDTPGLLWGGEFMFLTSSRRHHRFWSRGHTLRTTGRERGQGQPRVAGCRVVPLTQTGNSRREQAAHRHLQNNLSTRRLERGGAHELVRKELLSMYFIFSISVFTKVNSGPYLVS